MTSLVAEGPLSDQASQAYWNEPECCLDGFSAKFRKLLPNRPALQSQDTRLFLAEVFDRVLPTSTFAERIFARLNRWSDRKGPRPHLTTLAAKHAVFHFRHLTELWRQEEQAAGRVPKPRSQRARPTWAHGSRKGRVLNGTHVFAEEAGLDVSRVSRLWRLLAPQERERYAQMARVRNAQAKVLQAREAERQEMAEGRTGGFWNMSAARGFPMDRALVEKHQGKLAQLAQGFKEQTQELQAENEEGFQNAPPMPYPLWAPCHPQGCKHRLRKGPRQWVQGFQDVLREVILRKGPEPCNPSQEPLVLEFASTQARLQRRLVVACTHNIFF